MDEELIDLNDRKKFEKRIADALRQTIEAHGPITKEWIGSASKRVVAAVKEHNRAVRKKDQPSAASKGLVSAQKRDGRCESQAADSKNGRSDDVRAP